MESDLEALFLRAAAGDLAAFKHLEDKASPEAFHRKVLPRLTLSHASLASVLEKMRGDRASWDVAERWALFVLRGYIRPGGTRDTIDTNIDMDKDQLTIDILFRVSRLDDLPGPVTNTEVDEWMGSLVPGDFG